MHFYWKSSGKEFIFYISVKKLTYGSKCIADQCDDTHGLTCFEGHCACFSSYKFWSTTLKNCTKAYDFGMNCTISSGFGIS